MVKINDSCIGCGACESICDAVFKVEDKAVVESSAVAANEDCVKEAAEACPVGRTGDVLRYREPHHPRQPTARTEVLLPRLCGGPDDEACL